MNRRSLLVALGTTAAIAGCLDGRTDSPANENRTGTMGPGDEDQLRDRFGGEPVRPECEQTSETITVERGDETWERDTVATIPYPDPPRSFGTDEIAAYVESFEAAHVRHDAVCGSSDAIVGFAYNVRERTTLDWSGDPTATYLYYAGGATAGINEDGNIWAADLGVRGVVYGVDDTGTVRASVDGSRASAPDELATQLPGLLNNGQLVAAFE